MVRRLVPLLCIAALLGVTAGVWRVQVRHKHRLLARHTEDVSIQAARRLESFVATQLAVAGTLAEHWTRQTSDAERVRGFEGLAPLILAEFASYHALVLVDHTGRPMTSVAEPDSSYDTFLRERGLAMLEQGVKSGVPVVSDPYQVTRGVVSFFAAWPLAAGSTRGPTTLVVEYRVEELIADCFHGQIREEFSYSIEDEGETLFRFAHAGTESTTLEQDVHSVQTFAVQNRRWRLTVSPRPDVLGEASWRADLSVPIFGLALSIGMGLLIHLLQVRMERLRLSEARYRGVFDSATDGLLVLAADECGTIQEANPAATRMFGVPDRGLIGQSFGTLLGKDTGGRLAQLSGNPHQSRSVRFDAAVPGQNGDTLDVEVHASRFIHQGGPAILAIIVDVSERRAAGRRQLLLSQRALAAQEDERARLARDLHDDLGQLLTGLRLELDYVRRQHPKWAGALGSATKIVATAIDTVRRLCKGLRPPLLDDLGLESAVKQLIDEFSSRSACKVELNVELDEQHRAPPPSVALCAYRVLQEALTNVNRHANASTVRVTLASHDTELVVTVTDDGAGFEMSQLPETSGLGITGMLERSSLVDGRLEVTSAPDVGTRVELRIPTNGGAKDMVTA